MSDSFAAFGEHGDEGMRSDKLRCEVRRSWVICSPSNPIPIQLVRVSESWESVDDEKDLVDGCAPMIGSIQAFSEVGSSWYERYGAFFTGYENAEKLVEEAFDFDPNRGCWHLAKGDTQCEIWPISPDDCESVLDLDEFWPESLVRVLAAIPLEARGETLTRVPPLLRSRFARWCDELADSGQMGTGPLTGGRAFKRVVCDCVKDYVRLRNVL